MDAQNPLLTSKLNMVKYQEIYDEETKTLVYMHFKEDMMKYDYEF